MSNGKDDGGSIAEYYLEQDIWMGSAVDSLFAQTHWERFVDRQSEASPKVWLTKDLRRVPIVDLEDDHLKNIMSFVQRKKREKHEQLSDLPQWWELYAEAKKRGLR